MGVVDRRRHQRVGLAAGVAEHHALVAGALVLVAGGIDALGDVGRLRMQVAGDLRLVPAEAVLVVADVMDRHAGEMRQQVGRDRRGPAGFAGEHDAVGGDQRLAGDARIGIGGEIGVQHRVAEPVGDLVGVPFGDGFGGEQEFARIAHGWFLSRRGVWAATGGGRCVAETPLGVKCRAGLRCRAAIAQVAARLQRHRRSIRAEQCARDDRPEWGMTSSCTASQHVFRGHGGYDPDQCGTLLYNNFSNQSMLHESTL